MKMDEQVHDPDYVDAGVTSSSKLSSVEQEDGEVSDGSVAVAPGDEGEIVEEETSSEVDKEAENRKPIVDISKKTALEKLKNMKFNFKPKLSVRSPSTDCRDRERRDRQPVDRTDMHSPNRKDIDDERRQRKRRWEERNEEVKNSSSRASENDRCNVRNNERPKPLRDAVVLPPVRTPEPQKTYDQPTTIRQRIENIIMASETEVISHSDKDLRNLLLRMFELNKEQQRLLRGRQMQIEMLRDMRKQIAEEIPKLANRLPAHLRMDLNLHLQSLRPSSSFDCMTQVNGEISNGVAHGHRSRPGFPMLPLSNATPVNTDSEAPLESDRNEETSPATSGSVTRKAENGSALAMQKVPCYPDSTLQPSTLVSDTRQYEEAKGQQPGVTATSVGGVTAPSFPRPFPYMEFGQGNYSEGKAMVFAASPYDSQDHSNSKMTNANSIGQDASKEQIGNAPSAYHSVQDKDASKMAGDERIDVNVPQGLNSMQKFGLPQLEHQKMSGPQTYISNEKAISALMGVQQSAINTPDQKGDTSVFAHTNRGAMNVAHQETHVYDRSNQPVLQQPSLSAVPLLLCRGHENDGQLGASHSIVGTNPPGSTFGMFDTNQPCRYADLPQPALRSIPQLPSNFGNMTAKISASPSERDVHTSQASSSAPGFSLPNPAGHPPYSNLDNLHPPQVHRGNTTSVNIPPPDFSIPPPVAPVFGTSTPALAPNVHNKRPLEENLTPQTDPLQESTTRMPSSLAVPRNIPRMNPSVPPPAFTVPPPRSSLGAMSFAAPPSVSTAAPSTPTLASSRGPSSSLMSTPPPNIAFKKGQPSMPVALSFPPPNMAHPLPAIRAPMNPKNPESIQQMVSAIVSQSAASGQSPVEVVTELIASAYNRAGSMRLPESPLPSNRIMPSADQRSSPKSKNHSYTGPPRPLSKIHIPKLSSSSSRAGIHSSFSKVRGSQNRHMQNRQQVQEQQQQQHDKKQISDVVAVVPDDERKNSESHDDSNVYLIVSDEEEEKK